MKILDELGLPFDPAADRSRPAYLYAVVDFDRWRRWDADSNPYIYLGSRAKPAAGDEAYRGTPAAGPLPTSWKKLVLATGDMTPMVELERRLHERLGSAANPRLLNRSNNATRKDEFSRIERNRAKGWNVTPRFD